MPEQPYTVYRYETCSREEAKVQDGDVPAYFVWVPTDEVYRYILCDLRSLPKGAKYVRPVKGGS